MIDGGSCTAFGAPATAQATEMSVADVAEKANPAVVTILNMQPISQADLSGISGIEGFPDLPQIPGINDLPGSDQGPSDESATQLTATHWSRSEAVPGSSSTRLATSSRMPMWSRAPRS